MECIWCDFVLGLSGSVEMAERVESCGWELGGICRFGVFWWLLCGVDCWWSGRVSKLESIGYGVELVVRWSLDWVGLYFFLEFDLDDCWRQHEAKNCYICSITNVKHPPLQCRTDTGISTVKYTITVGDKKSCYK